MNSQACLLCGKTLNRNRVGGGEDFCSREHRNQYHLHRGLNRLSESNKTPTVIGRRELAKPLTRLFGSSAGEPRMAADSHDIRIMGQRRKPVLRPILPQVVSRMPKSEVVRQRLSVPPDNAGPREFQILRRLRHQPYGRRMQRIASPRSIAINRLKRTVLPAPAAKKGLTPRVPLAVRFRVSYAAPWQYRGSSLAGPHLVWTELPHRAAAREMTVAPRIDAVRMPSSVPSSREFRPRPVTPFEQPKARPVPARVSPRIAAPRETTMPLKYDPAPATLRVEMRRAQVYPGFARRIQRPAPSAAAHRIAAAPFAPQDPTLPTPVEEYQTR